MKTFLTKTLSIVLVLVLFCGIVPTMRVESTAAATKTKEQAVAWIKGRVGGSVSNMDGSAGYQCVDMVLEYYQFLGIPSPLSYAAGNAVNYASKTPPPGFTHIQDYYGFVPEAGDIAIWDVGYNGGGLGYCGHVGLVVSADLYSITIVEVWGNEYGSDSLIRLNTYPYSGGSYEHFWGVIRPAYASGTVAPTGITANEKQFTMTVGESKTVTATVSPTNANNKNVTWASSDTSVATVSNGVIKAVSSGGATITATNSAGHKVYVEVVVNPVNIIADGMVEHDGHTYEIFHSLMTWKQAKEYCEKQGGHLATITSKEENDAVLGLIEKYGNENCEEYFIGMIDEKSDGKYTWVTGEEATYENWDTGEPSNAPYVVCYERYQDYGAILKDGSWDDVNNYANVSASVFGFICEYEKEFTYDNITIIGNKVYELYEREYPIILANELATQKGGNLVTITSAKEQNAIIAWVQANSNIQNISIGANDIETEGVWQWYNGETWEFTSWVEGEPNDTNGIEDNAILILSSGKWNDVSGANAYSFVVEYTLDDWLALGNDANEIVFNELPDGADPDDYEIVTEYRYRDKETKSSTASSIDGWTLYDSDVTYGSWSSVQSTKTKPTASDTLQITGTWKQYHYYHYCNYYSNGGNNWNVDSIPYGSQSIRHDTYLNQQLPAISFPDQGNKQAYGGTGASVTSACDYNFYIWFYADEATFYNYQTRTKTTTNHFYKYGDWSAWDTTPVTATSNRQVETRTVYKLKDHKHTSSSWITDQEATVYKAGTKHKECTECGAVLKTETIPQLKCAKPVLKKVYNANSYVKVTWGTVKGADLYRVYRKTGTGSYEYIGSTKNTYFNDKEAGAGKTCRYRIRVKNEAGYSGYSVSMAIKHIDEPALKSIENSAYGVLIKWDKVTGAEKYNVYRKVSGGEYKYIGATSNTYYTDKTAKSGTKYYYTIRGKRDDSVSSQSASLSKYYLADPTLNTPSTTSKGVGLRWSEVKGAQGYMVYRRTASGSYKRITTEKGVSNVTFRDTTAKKGIKYYYKVKAYYSKTYSAYSNTKSVTDKY